MAGRQAGSIGSASAFAFAATRVSMASGFLARGGRAGVLALRAVLDSPVVDLRVMTLKLTGIASKPLILVDCCTGSGGRQEP